MNRQISLELKNFNFLDNLAVGYFVDAVDQGKWKVSKVVSIRSYAHRHVISLHFDGYPDKWNEDFQLPASSKLAPFRRVTMPYTGPEGLSRLEINRPQPDLDFTEPIKNISRFNSKKQLKPEFINQNLRGELFILVDNILTKKTLYPKQTYDSIVDFMTLYIKGAIHVLNFALEKIPQVSKDGIVDPNIIYISSTHALINSLPQFLYNLNSLLNKKEKRIKFHTMNQMHCPVDQLINRFRQIFLENKGVQLCKRIMQYQNPPHKSFSWSIKKQILILLSGLIENYQFPKVNDNRQTIQLLDNLNYISFKQVFPLQIIEKKHIELVINLIVMGNFEGKLRGLNQLKKLTDKTQTKNSLLIQQIKSSNILLLMTDNSTFNKELFRRSIPLFEFAEKKELLTDEIINRIINLQKDKHQLELKAYYEALVNFAKFLSQEKCLAFFNSIKNFPLDEYQVNLIRDYTIKTIDQHRFYKSKYMEKNAEFGIGYFWKIIENSSKYLQSLVDKVIEAFSVLMANIYYKNENQKFVKYAIVGIKQRVNVDAYMKIIHNSLKINRKVASIIENLTQEADLVDSVIKSLIESGQTSQKALQSVFQFLQEVNMYVRKKLTVQHIKLLWKITECRIYLLKFIRKHRPLRNAEKSTEKILLKQLNDVQIYQVIEKIFLSAQMMNNFVVVDDELFKTADQLIIAYNHSKKFIEYNYKHTIKTLKPEEMFGISFYLKIIANVQDQETARKATVRFVEFYLRPPIKRTFSSTPEKIAAWMVCIDHLAKLNNRSYLAYQIFFEEIYGRMKSLNVLEPSLVNLLVSLKGKNIKRNLILPRYTSLWKLRMIIGQEFGLEKSNFQMFFPTRNLVTDMEKQEDFSLALIQLPKDPANPAVVITSSKEIHPHFQTMEQFKNKFSASYGEKLYLSLETVPHDIQRRILAILAEVSSIKTLEKKIEKIDLSNGWQEILSINNKAKLEYQLIIIEKMKGMQWAISMIKKNGIQHIVKILAERNKQGSKPRPEDYKVLTHLLKLFHQLLKFYKTTKNPLPFTQHFIIEILKPLNQMLNNEILEYYYNLMLVLLQITNYPDISIPKIIEHSVMTTVFQIMLFGNSNSEASKRFPSTIISICEKGKCQFTIIANMQGFLNINLLVKNMYNSRQFFNTLVQLLNKNYVSIGLLEKIKQFITIVKKNNFSEEDQTTTNQLLLGWLKILKLFTLWEASENIKPKLLKENYETFSEYIIKQGLFNSKPRFKSSQCRLEAYEVLGNMPCDKLVYKTISRIIYSMLEKSTWRKQYDWYVRSFKKRIPNQQVGIKNLAATCYINSLLQQLFFIKQFRDPLLAIDGKKIEDDQNIVYEIQKIFSRLMYSDNTVYTTESLCRNFILDGQPIDPRIQTDVDQFFHSLMDKLERNLIKVDQKQLINDVFGGQYSNLIVGQQCPHKSQRLEHFLSMRLEIINKKSLNQALEQFIKGEVLEGDNAYFCEKCDKKVKALKKVCVKSLPQVLIFTLKRFQFDFDKMQKFKLNTYCQFPEKLDMFPYMRQAFYKDQEKMLPEQYYYNLKGTIIHCGLSEAGHYTSYIRTQNGSWKYFDDDKISGFDINQLSNQCFGGIQQNPYSDDSQKIKNSYILIYEKEKIKKRKSIKPQESIIAEVTNQNQRNQDIKLLFERGLINFFNDSALNMPEAYLLYLHIVILRSQHRSEHLVSAYEKCQQIFKDKQVCQWYLNQFSDSIIKQFLIFSHFEVSHFVASLVIICLNNAVNPQFIKRCMKCLDRKNMVPLNKVFQQAVIADQVYQKALAQFSFHDKVYRIIKEDKAPPTNNISKIPDVQSAFGSPAQDFKQKRDFRSNTELFLSIERFKISTLKIQDIQLLSLRVKKIPAQISLAKIIANKYKDAQNFEKLNKSFISQQLLGNEPKIQEEYTFVFVLILIKQLCQIKDDLTNARNKVLAEVYLVCIRQSLQGYKACRYLIQSLFNIAFQNPIFLNAFSELLNTQNKLAKSIREWVKDADKAYYNVKQRRLGYWKQPSNKYYYVPQSQLAALQRDQKINTKKYLGFLNSILEKHKIDYQSKWQFIPNPGDFVMDTDGYGNIYEVINKIGLLLQVKDQEGGTIFMPAGDVIITEKQ